MIFPILDGFGVPCLLQLIWIHYCSMQKYSKFFRRLIDRLVGKMERGGGIVRG